MRSLNFHLLLQASGLVSAQAARNGAQAPLLNDVLLAGPQTLSPPSVITDEVGVRPSLAWNCNRFYFVS